MEKILTGLIDHVRERFLERMVDRIKQRKPYHEAKQEEKELKAVWGYFLSEMFGQPIDFHTETRARGVLLKWQAEMEEQCKFDNPGYDEAVVARFAKVGTFERRDGKPVFVTKDGRVVEVPAYALVKDHSDWNTPEGKARYATWKGSEFEALAKEIFGDSATIIGVLEGIAKLAK